MKPSIQLRLHQQLSLTPQLQQAIRLLQLSRLELATELRQMAEANPMLELVEDGTASEPVETVEGASDESIDAPDPAWETTPDSPDTSLDFSRVASTSSVPRPTDFSTCDSAPESLRDHLMWQLDVTPMSPRDHAMAEVIIDALDNNGYLHESSEALLSTLPASLAVTTDELEAVRCRVQHLDPVGVASRSLRDCLDVQLQQLDIDTPQRDLARRIVADELDLLARNNVARLSQRLHVDPDAVATACALIRQLDPHPGSALDTTPVEYIIPDAYVRRHGNEWLVSLSPHGQPRMELNQHYCDLIHEVKRDDAAWLRGQLQEARWLLKSLEARSETVLKVAEAIVRRQRAFLEYGPEAMRPLVLREIAEEVDMHESTISRVTTRKYLNTPRGNFEFKYFFSSSVSTDDGGSASSTAIQAMLRKLVDEENTNKPLSDKALADALGQRGINVARRTIAKYREALRIPSSSERRRAN